MFVEGFGDYVCPLDTISCELDGYRFVARVDFDPFTKPYDYDQPGWCYDTTDEKYGAHNADLIHAWERDEWWYGSVIIAVYRGDVLMTAHAASLSGIECNMGENNAYLLEVANELLPEAHCQADEIVNQWFANLVRERSVTLKDGAGI